MQVIPLYRYNRPGGGVTISTVEPDGEYTPMFRLVAVEGFTLTNGETVTTCVDTDSPHVWHEVEATDTDETEQKALAYDIIMGVAE